MQKLVIDENFSNSIVFSYETILCKMVIRISKTRFRNDDNPRWMTEAYIQNPEKVNVSPGIGVIAS